MSYYLLTQLQMNAIYIWRSSFSPGKKSLEMPISVIAYLHETKVIYTHTSKEASLDFVTVDHQKTYP
jgi:hypothetical protein